MVRAPTAARLDCKALKGLKYPVYVKSVVFRRSLDPKQMLPSPNAAFQAELQQRAFIVRLRVDNYSWLSVTRRGLDYDPHIAGPRNAYCRIKKMVIETIVLLAFVFAIGAIVIKIYGWRQDVLYGPYIGRRSDRNG